MHQTCVLMVKEPHQEDEIHERYHAESEAKVIKHFKYSGGHCDVIADLNQDKNVDAT